MLKKEVALWRTDIVLVLAVAAGVAAVVAAAIVVCLLGVLAFGCN